MTFANYNVGPMSPALLDFATPFVSVDGSGEVGKLRHGFLCIRQHDASFI